MAKIVAAIELLTFLLLINSVSFHEDDQCVQLSTPAHNNDKELRIFFDEVRQRLQINDVYFSIGSISMPNLWFQVYYHLIHPRRVKSRPMPIKHCISIYILLLSGDISTNPGPVRYPCGGCYKPVAKNHRGIFCEACS